MKMLPGSLIAGAFFLSMFVPATAAERALTGDVIVVMNADGTREAALNVKSTTLLSTGNYEIITKVNITKCAVLATLGNPTSFGVANGTVTAVQRSGSNGKGFFVQTRDAAGAAANIEFTLHASCV
jgi:predicted extracellular nuclease